jgi:ATP synthase protein I
MASSGNDSDEDGHRRFDDRLRQRLDDVDRKLTPDRDRAPGLTEGERKRRSSALGKAFRLSTELVAGVVVGGGIGWALDRWLNTKPILLVVFLILGVVAGLVNTVRIARQMERE